MFSQLLALLLGLSTLQSHAPFAVESHGLWTPGRIDAQPVAVRFDAEAAVYEELPDLLTHCQVSHHDRQLDVVRRAQT